MELLIIKAVTAVVIVITLSIIAEKVSAKLSGILSGLPLGTMVVLIFFAIEHGINYSVEASLYNIHGLLALLSFIIGYYISTFYKRKFDIFVSIIVSFVFYLVAAFILAHVPIHVVFTPIAVITIITLVTIYFAKIPDNAKKINTKITFKDLVLRTILTVVIFLLVTSIPKIAPVNIAGIFSAFPSMMFPLLLIVHFNHSGNQARTILKNTPSGLSSIVIFCVSVHFTYPMLGVFLGTLVSFITCIIYIVIQLKLLDYFGVNVNAKQKKSDFKTS
ncbi:hypothetical protein [Malaciobacter marinus]|uniref:Putative membrane protein n=1 Tax=Malaciobacter marinus TaxID=505249 RepID=A0A347TLW0_9BACT|nr:hypothetical protein [Malaciobacter marinus]AXX87588.1 putative membrane protein [Malaciobacter marinus]